MKCARLALPLIFLAAAVGGQEEEFLRVVAAGIAGAKTQTAPPVGRAAPAANREPKVKTVDFHTHSYCSDGLKGPEQMVQQAKDAGVLYYALTDHDTVACLARAQAAAKEAGITFVPGIEISAEDDSVHILGLGISAAFGGWKDFVDKSRKERVSRTKKIIAELNKLPDPDEKDAKIKIDLMRDILIPRLNAERSVDKQAALTEEEAQALTEEEALKQIRGQITRPDIAKALVTRGYVLTPREAFDKYLGDDAPAGVPMDAPPFQDIIKLIHDAGGIAILAHPFTIYKFKGFPLKYHDVRYADFDSFAKALIESGLDGFESFRTNYQKYPEDAKTLQGAIKNSGTARTMVMSIGSDYHGYDQGGLGAKSIGKIGVTVEQTRPILNSLNLR